MRETHHPSSWRLIAVSALMFVGVAGCDMLNMSPPPAKTAANAPAPRVDQDCTVFNISTPTRYACNGKVYTSYQLAKMRMDAEKKYASGK